MTITTEDALRMAGGCDIDNFPIRAAALRSLAAERDALKAENEKLKVGGCARGQSTTQFCAEAVTLKAENAKLAASNHAYLSDYQEARDEIEKLRAAVQDLAKHIWRGDWDKLKPETRELLGEKQ